MSNRESQSGRRGFVAITTAVMLIGMLAFTGLAIDIGYLEWTRRRAQVAADAAAMGASLEAQRGGNTAALVQAGRADSSLNGFTDGQNSTTVIVNYPPLFGRLAGSNKAVEAVVTRSVPTFFLGVIGRNGATVRARAVGRVGPGTACIFALNKHASGTLTVSGSAAATSGCDALVSSDDPTSAFNMNGSQPLNMGNHARVGVVGGWSSPNVWDTMDNRQVNPEHTFDRGDPLAWVPEPRPTGATPIATNLTRVQPNQTMTFSPGVYCGGLDILGTAILSPGTYILAGGGLTSHAQATIQGAGVTIYNTSSTGWGCAPQVYAYAAIDINAQATTNLSAPTGGSLAGIAFFQDRAITSATVNKFNGGASLILDGALYIPNSPIQFTGGSSNSGYTFLVADMIDIGGGSSLKNDTSSLPEGSPLRIVATVAE